MEKRLKLPFYEKEVEVMFYRTGDDPGSLDLGLLAFEEGYPEPWTDLTVRVRGAAPCAPDEAYVKTWSENEGIDKWLEDTGLAKPTGEYVLSGYVKIPKYQFNLNMVEQYMFETDLF